MFFLIIFFACYTAIALATFPIATRIIYNRQRSSYDNAVVAYRDALIVGASCAVFWPVSIPAALTALTAFSLARVVAPPEIKKMVNEHNVKMLELSLGMRDEPTKIIN